MLDVIAAMEPKPKRSFKAATVNNITSSWLTTGQSSNAELFPALKTLRARSRNLCNNDPYYSHALTIYRTNVVGPRGIRLQCRFIRERDKQGRLIPDKADNLLVEEAFKEWGKKGNCTTCGKYSWREVQELVIDNTARDGEMLIQIHRGTKYNKFGFALQLIEADHLDEELNGRLKNGNTVTMGVEYDGANKPVAYHLLKYHPGDTHHAQRESQKHVRVEAKDMIHLYRPQRASQTRGFPWATPGMERAWQLAGYEDAEVVKSRVSSCKMGFFTSEDGAPIAGDGEGVDSFGDSVTINSVEPGKMEQLPAGVKFESYDPQHPTTAFKDFIKSVLRGISAAWGFSYNTLANDLEGVNYSSLRQGNLNDRDFWRVLQVWLIENLHERIYDDWLIQSITTAALPLPITKLPKYKRVRWRPRGWQGVDALKDMKANGEAIDRLLKSPQEVVEEEGRDIEEVLGELQEFERLKKEMGLEAKTDMPTPPQGAEADDEENE